MTETTGPVPTSQGVVGYRDLTDDEIEAINHIKRLEEAVAVVWRDAQAKARPADPRWTAIARTHFQEGFSALVRSIAQPFDPFDAV